MENYYNFCGVPFRIAAPEALWEDSDSPKFACLPCAPAITIEISSGTAERNIFGGTAAP